MVNEKKPHHNHTENPICERDRMPFRTVSSSRMKKAPQSKSNLNTMLVFTLTFKGSFWGSVLQKGQSTRLQTDSRETKKINLKKEAAAVEKWFHSPSRQRSSSHCGLSKAVTVPKTNYRADPLLCSPYRAPCDFFPFSSDQMCAQRFGV